MGRKEETLVAKQHVVKERDKSCSDERARTDIEKLFGYQGNVLGFFFLTAQ